MRRHMLHTQPPARHPPTQRAEISALRHYRGVRRQSSRRVKSVAYVDASFLLSVMCGYMTGKRLCVFVSSATSGAITRHYRCSYACVMLDLMMLCDDAERARRAGITAVN